MEKRIFIAIIGFSRKFISYRYANSIFPCQFQKGSQKPFLNEIFSRVV